jgi:outer membrane protein insertion porin family/translocation and assembly module TamA
VADREAERARALQIIQIRGFYSGGVNSNRGYGYSGVNPQEVVPLITGDTTTPVPVGGRYLWNASLELRIAIVGNFGASVFVDASDVWNTAPVGPHLSPGVGLRYMTPIGPARLDLAYRVPGLQVVDGYVCESDPDLAGCPPAPLGLPVYLALAIGQPF